MRPCADGASDARMGVVLASAAPIEEAAGWVGSDNFLRAGNNFSLAAEKRLEIDAEVRFHRFAATSGAGAVAEDDVVLHGFVERRW